MRGVVTVEPKGVRAVNHVATAREIRNRGLSPSVSGVLLVGRIGRKVRRWLGITAGPFASRHHQLIRDDGLSGLRNIFRQFRGLCRPLLVCP